MILGEDVLCGNADGTPLLRAGTSFSAAYVRSLLEHGINAVYVEDAVSAGIVVPRALSPELKATATATVAKAMTSLRELKPADAGLGDKEIAELASVAALIAEHVAGSAEIGMALVDLSTADGHVYEHSVNVAALGLLSATVCCAARLPRLVGQPARRDAMRLVRLGLGLLLHDLGKLAIPAPIIDKTDPSPPRSRAPAPPPGARLRAAQNGHRDPPRQGGRALPSRALGRRRLSRRQEPRRDRPARPRRRRGQRLRRDRQRPPARRRGPPRSAGARSSTGAGLRFDPLVVDVFRESSRRGRSAPRCG